MFKKAQMNIFSLTFFIIVFFLFLAGGLGYFVITMSGIALTMGGFGGIEAFFVGNLILWIILVGILVMLWYARAV